MDAALLRSLLEKVIALDEKHQVQSTLGKLKDAAANLSANPGEASYQTTFASEFSNFREALIRFGEEMTAGEWDRLAEINSKSDFDMTMEESLSALVAANPATPAVINTAVETLYSERKAELAKYGSLKTNLEYFGFSEKENDPDHAQIGFKIPRELFSNEFHGFITELNFLKKLIRLVTESNGEQANEIELGTVSTTDPIIWLVVAYTVAKSFGSLGNWALATWKTVEEIREIRAKTHALKSFNDEEIENIFGKKIRDEIKVAIESKVTEMTTGITPAARKNELKNGLRLLLEQFLARVERGLTVDIRYLTPPVNDDEERSESDEAKRGEIQTLSSTLIFKRPVGEPVLQLTAANDSESPEGKSG